MSTQTPIKPPLKSLLIQVAKDLLLRAQALNLQTKLQSLPQQSPNNLPLCLQPLRLQLNVKLSKHLPNERAASFGRISLGYLLTSPNHTQIHPLHPSVIEPQPQTLTPHMHILHSNHSNHQRRRRNKLEENHPKDCCKLP
jgi:hypothetical protein